jgi:lipopolysaccharide/colanic/teichoic acid biosynthesis glycosyltransferase
MANISLSQRNKPTSFHSIAISSSYIGILTLLHYATPYIHELVYSFFNGLFLILSLILSFYFNALLRTSSILHFSYASLVFRVVLSAVFLALSMIAIAFMTNTTEIIKKEEFISFYLYISFFNVSIMILAKRIYGFIKPKSIPNIIFLTNLGDIEGLALKNSLMENTVNVKKFHTNQIKLMMDYAVNNGIEGVYVYIDSKNLNMLEPIIKELSIYAFNLYWILPQTILQESYNVNSQKPIQINSAPVYLDTNQYLLKRSVDVLGALFALLLILPISIIVAIFIKMTDGGSILYTQLRHGRYGKEFMMYKFRSMIVGSDSTDQQVFDNDLRVTWIGKIMRKTSFDELPQLLNILKGEMSLVGPRPHIISDTHLYSKKILKFLTRHHVKPGLTGLAQIRARGKTDSLESMQEKLNSDLEYINEWTFFLDLKILLNTPLSIWKNRNTNV